MDGMSLSKGVSGSERPITARAVDDPASNMLAILTEFGEAVDAFEKAQAVVIDRIAPVLPEEFISEIKGSEGRLEEDDLSWLKSLGVISPSQRVFEIGMLLKRVRKGTALLHRIAAHAQV